MKWLPILLLSLLSLSSQAQTVPTPGAEITNLDELLASVRQQQQAERERNRSRERTFLQARDRQQALLKQARRDFDIAQKENNPLQKITALNAEEIDRLKTRLTQRTQEMGDIYSLFNEVAGDVSAQLQQSMTSVEFPERLEALQQLADKQTLATIEDLEQLWLLLQEDMTATAKVAVLTVPVVSVDGHVAPRSVTRVGGFTAFDDQQFLRYVPEVGELLALQRQPAQSYRAANQAYVEADPGSLTLVTVDPTSGALLGVLSFEPTLEERVAQGGVVGMIIVALGGLGLLLTCWRLGYLGQVYLAMRRQRRHLADPRDDNPLGRVILQARACVLDGLRTQEQGEALQYQLDEAVLVEVPALERGHGFIKLLAATAPLLGLLGTVTGMILTFQSISLFGSGDPKLMASGISQALVTTVLGLVVAIPLLFGHSVVASLARIMIQRLDEQSAGIMAEHMGAGENIL